MRAAWVEINLSNLDYNIKQIKEKVGPNRKITAVIKADAYGHGAVKVANVLRANGINSFAVATLSEAVRLRNVGNRHSDHYSGTFDRPNHRAQTFTGCNFL